MKKGSLSSKKSTNEFPAYSPVPAYQAVANALHKTIVTNKTCVTIQVYKKTREPYAIISVEGENNQMLSHHESTLIIILMAAIQERWQLRPKDNPIQNILTDSVRQIQIQYRLFLTDQNKTTKQKLNALKRLFKILQEE